MNSNVFKLKQLIELAQEVGLDESEWFISIVRRLAARWNENLYQKTLEMVMNSDLRPLLNTTFPVPTSKEDMEAVDGPYKIGTIANTSTDFGFHPLQLQMHCIIGGQTGFGKSTLTKVLCQQILAEGEVLVWLIDPKGEGGDFRFLGQQFDNVVVLRPDVLKCNPFTHIPNVPVEVLRESITEVTADSWGVYDASEGVILEHIQRVFEQHEQPSFFDFIKSLRSEKVSYGGRRQSYHDTIKTRLVKAQISLGDIINCKADYFTKLYDKNVVFEIGGLSGSAQRVLVPWMIMKLVLYKIKNPTPTLSHLLIFDEAQSQIWSRKLEMRGRTSSMADLATQARAFGLGIIVLAQNPATKLMTEIIANSCAKLCFHLGSGEEVNIMARHMGLTYEQMDIFHHLRRGEAICRVGLGYTEPFQLDIYNFQDQPLSNYQVSELMKTRWSKLLEGIEPVIAGKRKSDYPRTVEKTGSSTILSVTDISQEKSVSPSKSDTVPQSRSETSPDALSSDELTYLRILATHPGKLLTEVYALVNDPKVMGIACMGRNKAVRVRQKLLKKRYLELDFGISGSCSK